MTRQGDRELLYFFQALLLRKISWLLRKLTKVEKRAFTLIATHVSIANPLLPNPRVTTKNASNDSENESIDAKSESIGAECKSKNIEAREGAIDIEARSNVVKIRVFESRPETHCAQQSNF